MAVLTGWEEEEDVIVEDDIGSGLHSFLIVFNDDHNSFDWVVKCFMEVLRYSSEQAEQLSIIIHNRGKATVKTGAKAELLPFKHALIERGLSVVIEE